MQVASVSVSVSVSVSGTTDRGEMTGTLSDIRPKVLLIMERVLLIILLGFPPGVPPPQGLSDPVARFWEEAFLGVAEGEGEEEKNPDERPSLALSFLPPPPTLDLRELFRRHDTRRTSVRRGANALGVLIELKRRGEYGRVVGETVPRAAGDGGVEGARAVDRLVEGGAVYWPLLLPGERGPTADADNAAPPSFLGTVPRPYCCLA